MYNWRTYSNGIYNPYQRPKQCNRRNRGENTINIDTRITQTVTSNSNGGTGGTGGNSSLVGGSASAAVAADESLAIAISNSESETESTPSATQEPPTNEEFLQTNRVPESNTATAVGGSALDGVGGEGGRGGDGGTSAATATAEVTNVVIVSYDGISPTATFSLGVKDKSVDITVDKDGNTLVNGQKMHEEALDNGTKVFIFRTSETKTK